jgi:glycosyltransferase involved in cell wall biosynthesis
MKAAYIVRNNLYTAVGGDTKQIELTAKKMRDIGVEVDILLASKKDINYKQYDLLHFFNIIRPQDILPHIHHHKKIVISTIYVDYYEYELNVRQGLLNWLTRIFGKNGIEYLKSIARDIKTKSISSWSYYWMGHKKAIQYIAKRTTCFLPNSENEWKRFTNDYGIEQASYFVIPNSIDAQVFGAEQIDFSVKDNQMVLCVAQIEGRKNQYNLIQALNDQPFELYIIGNPASNQLHYYERCRSIAKSNIHFKSFIPWEELKAYYQKAGIHILPSYFETTGLSSLEAAVMGCKIIVTDKGDTVDYFGKDALYCDPYSLDSIRKAIAKAASTEYSAHLRNRIIKENTWEITAAKTKQAYLEVLKNFADKNIQVE